MAPNGSKAMSSEFTPGSGLIPPYLAGRESEQRLLSRQHERVAAGRMVPAEVVLIGPRGNGKTALLRWFESTIRERGDVDVVWITPTEVASVQEMVEAFAPDAAPGQGRVRASLGPLSGEWTFGGKRYRNLRLLLVARCRRKPLIVLLDEAHRLDLAVGEGLLNASQGVRGEAPFLLCLAGTPGLADHLNRMNASFVGRSRELRIRLLDRAPAEAALVEPLRAGGLDIEPEALAAIIEARQHYPYFIQVWGDALFKAAAITGAATITPETVEAARPSSEQVRGRFYLDRYDELKQAGLLPAAEAVARAFRRTGASVLREAAVDRALENAGAGLAERQALNARDYIRVPLHPAYRQRYGEADVWEPGIPSLMAHMLDKAAMRREA